MAYDKAVDSAALDAAITYTAQRIRAKTGDAALLPWNAAKGLGDAVDAIQAGGGVDLAAVEVYVADFTAPGELTVSIGALDKYERVVMS